MSRERLIRPLPWREPWPLVNRLAQQRGLEGLVWLDGDGTALGRTSTLALAPLEQLECRGLPAEAGASDPFAALRRVLGAGGAWLGWLGYEAGAWVEPGSHWRSPDTATLWAARYDPLLRFDLHERRLWLEGDDRGRLLDMAALIESCPEGPGPGEAGALPSPGLPPGHWHWHTTPEAFADQVTALREWIAAGDLFQANLTACRELLLPQPVSPLELYGRLRRHCPAPFGGVAIASLGQDGEAVLSASPERFLRLQGDGRVETRPIKGTRPRHPAAEADAAAAADLITSAKDRAENVMIVDLLRNDLGRVCRSGSIGVPQLLGLESYRQVHHLTSVVEGSLRPEADLVDLLRACWPGGSITGAPKVRACQRLGALEPVPRGPYCGSLFLLEADGRFDSNILIRSLMLRGRRLRAHAGCGIVADSSPAAEAEELAWKLDPLLEALA
ncbi:anthranilate synthase component I family protein [Synechococcus sp. EJ6-Ellesmere]|uniref:anthranilate synthase component I family protein n=1 Tax=Synechococcus sp. EJ6-Ellesmere TaxID=2823734 RepID=UPI0020CF676D|nr:anthranilate synthase component I family protein [Synechococcus sp. EJ6-Ellesmere]MCP9824107.1 anthranilate synthase component I family protein [Synechococcus sp. EJ6-Ellesmere]